MTGQIQKIFVLNAMFLFKHFICDYPFQSSWMALKKGNKDWDFFLPLLSHALVHGFATLFFVMLTAPHFWWLALVDFVTHFIMDRIKSGPKYLGRFNDPAKHVYWNILGFDQFFHHLTDLTIVWIIITKG